VIVPNAEKEPILRGIKTGDIWGPTDVYGVRLPFGENYQPLVLGQVLTGMKPTDPPVSGKQNEPMMPIAWTKTYKLPDGKLGRAFTTTMGASQDLESEGLRRLLVNASFWCMDMESQITDKLKVDIVGKYEPTGFKFNGYKKDVKPSDHVEAELVPSKYPSNTAKKPEIVTEDSKGYESKERFLKRLKDRLFSKSRR